MCRQVALPERRHSHRVVQARNRTRNRQKPTTSRNSHQPTEAEVHHVTNIVIERKTVSPGLESITWLNRELAWIVIFLWLLALGIGATAAIIFAIDLFNKAAA